MQLFDRIKQAHLAIRPQVLVTPLDHSLALSKALGCEVWLKNDHLQPTGSFKVRGATNKVRLLNDQARKRGVITASTGNHGQAVARAGRLAGVPVAVYVSASTAPSKMEGIRALGGELVVVDGPPIDAELLGRKTAAEDGRAYVPPYNDLDTMAGQGTLGMELHEQAPDLDAVFIAVGGGGLIGGTATALKGLGSTAKVVGVWCENSAVMLRCLEAGRIIEVEEHPTLTDGTVGALEPGSVTFPVCQQVIDDRVIVDEAGIADGMRRVAEAERWMVEGSAGMAMAGLVAAAERYKGAKVAVVLCGRNIAPQDFANVILRPAM
jgi:threonine dehydratase